MGEVQDTRQSKAVPEFPIVGIGASAGGLNAAGIFLEHTPADTGMAFVLVFHLDPKHKSTAAELLQRHTRMPVAQVEGRTRIEPDHVYVIPPNHGLTMADGALLLTQRVSYDGRPTVIDHFFRSLAEHAGERSVGVVLSGTGSEGSQGLMAIKEAGGLTVVQDEAEAEYGGMPHSAIATGQIDFVLPVAAMPAKLLEVRDFPIDFAANEADREKAAGDADVLQKIFVQLRTQAGHDFSQYKQNTVLRRIARRMQVHQVQDLSAYLELLRGKPGEAEALFRELLISVTSFFRDPEAMAALEREVMPQLCKRIEDNHTLRVWVPGCATGEEAYSIAMLLAEACDGLTSTPRLQIFATDLDERALGVARRGVYLDAIAGDVSEARLKRFFDREGDGFVVKPFMREMILFTRHDLLQDPPFSRLDLISCRNVLIYLKAEIQSRIFGLFHFALKPQGWLFLGGSESLGESGKRFSEIDRKAKIFQARRMPLADVHFPLLPVALPGGTLRRATDEPRKRFEEIARGELIARYAPPCVIVGENYDVAYISGRVGKYLEPGAGEANYNVLDMAREELRLELRTALYRVFHAGESVRRKPVRVRANGSEELVGLSVRPLKEAEGHALVVFEELESAHAAPEPPRVEDGDGDDAIVQLERELKGTRESLQTSIEELETSNEELRASNEELQSVNEELQSTTEELETGKEELQATNEELLAVNQELRTRNDELARANSDLANFLASTDVATLFLDNELRVRRYTPRTTGIFNIIAGDVGRPFAHLTHKLKAEDLVADAERVLTDLGTVEKELAAGDGHFYQTRLKPYRTIDNKVGGVVMTLVDVTERHRHEEETRALNHQLEIQKAFVESIIATVREPMLVLDKDLRVVTASRAFLHAFDTTHELTEHRLLFELGDRQWDIPELRRLLGTVLPERATIDSFEVRQDFGKGERTLLLNARRLRQAEGLDPLILLAFEDISERTRAQRDLHASEVRSRQILDSATDYAIIAMDPDGRITLWNEGAHRVLGWSPEEVLGQSIETIFTPEDIAADVPAHEMQNALTRDRGLDERWHLRKGGERFWASGEMMPLLDDAGMLLGFVKVLRDRTERRRANEHRDLLIHELNHRVKNTLATVQALALQTFRDAGMRPAVEAFDARLLALSAAHDVLTRENWQGASIAEIVSKALTAWTGGSGSRIAMDGPDLRLRPSAALALAMALHELATNASKHGALSNKRGKVVIRWSLSGDVPAVFRLQWQERGGPRVRAPSTRGFGSRLIEHGLAQDLGGTVKLIFDEAGVVCTIEAPLDEIREREPHDEQ